MKLISVAYIIVCRQEFRVNIVWSHIMYFRVKCISFHFALKFVISWQTNVTNGKQPSLSKYVGRGFALWYRSILDVPLQNFSFQYAFWINASTLGQAGGGNDLENVGRRFGERYKWEGREERERKSRICIYMKIVSFLGSVGLRRGMYYTILTWGCFCGWYDFLVGVTPSRHFSHLRCNEILFANQAFHCKRCVPWMVNSVMNRILK